MSELTRVGIGAVWLIVGLIVMIGSLQLPVSPEKYVPFAAGCVCMYIGLRGWQEVLA